MGKNKIPNDDPSIGKSIWYGLKTALWTVPYQFTRGLFNKDYVVKMNDTIEHATYGGEVNYKPETFAEKFKNESQEERDRIARKWQNQSRWSVGFLAVATVILPIIMVPVIAVAVAVTATVFASNAYERQSRAQMDRIYAEKTVRRQAEAERQPNINMANVNGNSNAKTNHHDTSIQTKDVTFSDKTNEQNDPLRVVYGNVNKNR